MLTVSVHELGAKAEEIIRQVRDEGEEYIITYEGKPCGVLLPLDEEELEDLLLSSHPYFLARRRKAREEIERGEVATPEELAAL